MSIKKDGIGAIKVFLVQDGCKEQDPADHTKHKSVVVAGTSVVDFVDIDRVPEPGSDPAEGADQPMPDSSEESGLLISGLHLDYDIVSTSTAAASDQAKGQCDQSEN